MDEFERGPGLRTDRRDHLVYGLVPSRMLWEILVPAYSNNGKEFPLSKHQAWDAKVERISGGITVLRSAKGTWAPGSSPRQTEKVIPVRFTATEEEAEDIMIFTCRYYKQKVVMCYAISTHVLICEESNGTNNQDQDHNK